MKAMSRKTIGGFVLLEALVAILIVSLGILGLAQLEAHIVGSAGEAKARSAAMALARSKMDEFRGSALLTQYAASLADGTQDATKDGVAFHMMWTVTQPSANIENRLVQIAVTWTDRAGNTQTVNLNSQVAWNDPALGKMTQQDLSKNLIAPTGAAKRGTGGYRPGDQAPSVVTGSDNVTKLVNSAGETILYLDPVSGVAQSFTKIYGRVYFDNSSNQLPSSANTYVRLSSEGECIYDHADANLSILPAGSSGNATKYKYFSYVCYVGPGWYGNVGVSFINENTWPTVCVGDPKFSDTSFTATPVARPSATRSYRGFRQVTSGQVITYLSTGVAGGRIYGDDGMVASIKDGKPKPSDFNAIYGIAVGASSDFFNQDFLISKITGQGSCADQMSQITNLFSPNAGQYYCIAPDNWTADFTSNRCPTTWPGFPSGACAITVAGSFNPPITPPAGSTSTRSVTCSVTDGSTCSCTATAGTANYSCSLSGGASQTVTVQGVQTTTGWNSPTTPQCIPSSACVAPAGSSTVQYQCAQSACASGSMLMQSRAVSTGNWSNTACVPAASCSPPSNTSTMEYQCAQSSCLAGEMVVESRTVTQTWSSWSDITTYGSQSACNSAKPPNTSTAQYQCAGSGNKTLQSRTLLGATYGSWTDAAPTCSGSCLAPAGFTAGGVTVNYQCAKSTCSGQNQLLQHQSVTYGAWGDMGATCVSTSASLPADTATTRYSWLAGTGTNGCPVGTQILQTQSTTGTTTQTCSRTSGNLGCTSISNFNIDNTTGTCQ